MKVTLREETIVSAILRLTEKKLIYNIMIKTVDQKVASHISEERHGFAKNREKKTEEYFCFQHAHYVCGKWVCVCIIIDNSPKAIA